MLYERHLATTKEWFPHDYVPYGRGRAGGRGRWTEADADLAGAEIDDGVRSALIVNLLTEDNLPYYFRTIERMFGSSGVFGSWVRRWTAEEGRHAMAIYGYLMVTRAVDPVALERARMSQVSDGRTPEPPTAADGMVYVALQELATRISHYNTGRLIGDPAGFRVMKRVAADENLHHLFYRDLVTAALRVDPSAMVRAIER
jgi:acyl-[acyl-carrier-protein] desaturase